MLCRLRLVALLLLLSGWTALPSAAQVIRANQTLFGRLGVGTSVSETDVSTYAVEPYSLHGELGYQFSRSLSLGVGLTWADYPKANFRNTTMTTLQGLGRWTIFPNKPATPYFNAGPSLTVGGDNPAAGVLFGLGVDYVLTHRTSVFAEATAYTTFPDDAIDSRDDGRATFDGLGFWGAGIRTTLKAAPHAPELQPIEAPDRLYRGVPVDFTVRVNEAATPPIHYEWSFGDGQKSDGLVAGNTYRLEGPYTVEVRAYNAAGSDVQRLTVQVEEPAVPPRIVHLGADTLTVQTHQLVRFAADLNGTAPLDVTWDFGDGTAPAIERASHGYDGDRYIGAMRSELSQGYVFDAPGTYTVTLHAENGFGDDERSVLIEVVPGPQRLLASTDVVTPCDVVQPPDTVHFAFDRSSLDADARRVLDRRAEHLAQCPNQLLELDGYADWVGTAAYNDGLSQRRADAVAAYFVENGISSDRIVTRAGGEIQPPCPAGNPGGQGCRAFRRVEAMLVMDDRPIAGRSQPPVQNAALTEVERAWTIVVASHATGKAAARSASAFRTALRDANIPVHRYTDTVEGRHRVTLGLFPTSAAALAAQRSLRDRLPDDAWLLEVTELRRTDEDVAEVVSYDE